MADNYIERQYEQYEARKAAWEKARKYGKKKTGITHPARTDAKQIIFYNKTENVIFVL